jgi:hypothetical protein
LTAGATRWRWRHPFGNGFRRAATALWGTHVDDLVGRQDPATIENLSDGLCAIVALPRQLVKYLLGIRALG